jgi:Na+:H+ antiporter, NhaA family
VAHSAATIAGSGKPSLLMRFFRMEPAGGIMLMIATVLAVLFANSALADLYDVFLHSYITVTIAGEGINKPVIYWINDGLMAIFFLLIGLEIKREMMEGELSSINKAILPLIAAAGGVALPAIIYAGFNWGDETAMRGWAIPAATDIAFALGILALFGKRVPITLKIFLTAVAVIDDLAAIVIIAIFYTSDLSFQALMIGFAFGGVLLALNLKNNHSKALYVLIGTAMWVAVLKSGVHATLAGVALGLLIPHRGADGKTNDHSMLRQMEHGLHPWVAFVILPVFAFANAGVNLGGLTLEKVMSPVPLGIAFGLFFGKQVGVFLLSKLAIKTGIARLPEGVNWMQFYGVCMLCGVGFTMSLFIGGLAFEDASMGDYVRVGVLMGSIMSALAASAALYVSLPKQEKKPAVKAA